MAVVETAEVTKILLIDDHALFRAGVRQILDLAVDLRVVGEAANCSEALALVRETKPDVVVLDVGIPGDRATTTTRRILAQAPGTRIVIVSMFDDAGTVRDLLDAGASAYLLKSVTQEELISTLRGVRIDGRLVLAISRRSFDQVSGARAQPLSKREVEVLELVAQAFSNVQIAHRLNIAEGTVKRHLRTIFGKLDATSRLDAVNKAMATDLIAPYRLSRQHQEPWSP
ncbi:response regulator [Actinoplanes sp. NPDC004185]